MIIDWHGTICDHRLACDHRLVCDHRLAYYHRLACDHRLAWNHRTIDRHGTIDWQTEEENVLSLLEINHRTSENECYLEQIKTSAASDCVHNFRFP